MFCRNCGNPMDNNAAVCIKCGVATGQGVNFCPNCGAQTQSNASVCTQCGVALAKPISQGEQKSKMTAGLLALFLGGFGIHNFYLGYTGKGIAQIALTFLLCGTGGIWGLIEGILILTGSIKTDAKGVPLKD